MKSFFKSLLASILGCGIVLGVFFLILVVFMGALLSLDTSETYVVKKNSVLYLNLSGEMVDRVEKNPLSEFFGDMSASKLSLVDVLNSIELAKNDNNISGIYIKAGALSASGASLTEIRNALENFKEETNKFVVAYGDIYTQGCYYLSTVADKVVINPEGSLDIHGFSVSPMFYKGLFDKVGVEMQIFKVGTFKSAVEPYINTEMSDANREQVKSYITDMWKTISKDITDTRKIGQEKLDEIADLAPALRETKYVLDNKLVDTLMYESEVHKHLKDLMGVAYDKKIALVSPENMVSAYPEGSVSGSKDLIAILYAEGTITSGSGRDGITDGRYIKELKKLEDDKNIKAVVFRVNSPGGSAYASEQIWKAVEDLKAKKPVVVSMGDVAASGGYYISSNASKIFAQPNTITGSIGIFGMFPNIEGVTGKLGLTFDNVKTHKLADFGDITRPMRENEKILLQNYVDRGYDLFTKRCAEGRGVSVDSINTIGQGRVWTGNQALALGLVDEIGGITDAVDAAAELAGLDNYNTTAYPKPVDFIQSFFVTKKEDLASQMMQEYLGTDYQMFKVIKEIKNQDYIQARLPYGFDVR